jgi:hypothetical protein
MKVLEYVAIMLSLLALMSFIVYNYSNTVSIKKYDCRIAEISPDIPLEIKNECRKKGLIL